MNYRPERVSSLIKDELAKIIVREMEFPDSLVTITDIIADKKLDNARVLVSVIPESKSEYTLNQLEKEAHNLQFLLNRKLNIKPMPRIKFELDRGAENAAVIEKIIIENE